MIKIDNLIFGYDRRSVAVDDACASLGEGIWLLLGENGAGKTTLLRLLCGLLKPSEGYIEFDGDNPAGHRPSVMRRLFFVPDSLEVPAPTINALAKIDAAFYPNFSPERLHDNLAAFSLTGDERIAECSLGTRHKLFAAYAFSLGVDLLLLDEPTNGLDIQSKKVLRHIMASCVDENQTVIISTHNIEDVRDLCDSLMVMRKGKIILAKPVEEIEMILRFVQGPDSAPGALYSERRGPAVISVTANGSGTPSQIDYAALYSMLMTDDESILKLLHDNE